METPSNTIVIFSIMKLKPQTAFLTLVAIAGAIVLSTVFFITGYAVGEKAGFEGVKERLVGYLPTSTNSAKSLDGTVKEVRDGTLVMTTGTVSANPLDAQGPSERSIKVNASTKISESTPKTSVQMKAEQDAYHEAVSKGQLQHLPLLML